MIDKNNCLPVLMLLAYVTMVGATGGHAVVDVRRGFFLLDEFTGRRVDELQKAAVVAAGREQPRAVGVKRQPFDAGARVISSAS